MASKTYKRPTWVKSDEAELCPDCFKAVGVKSRYKLICELGKLKDGANVTTLTKKLKLRQPTVTHHLNVLKELNAVKSTPVGRERIYTLNPEAHCFEECKIPYA